MLTLIAKTDEFLPAIKVRLQFLQDMFLPIDHQVYLFWEHHFGIIGVEETMVVDEVVLF